MRKAWHLNLESKTKEEELSDKKKMPITAQ
jgi:hypothetical protein